MGDITDELAKHKVMPIESAATNGRMRHVLLGHIHNRKAEHLSAMFQFFKHRCGHLDRLRRTGQVEYARAYVHDSIDSNTTARQFTRERLHNGLKQLLRPIYHPVIPVVEMAKLVHA